MLAVSPAFELTGAEEKGLQGVFLSILFAIDLIVDYPSAHHSSSGGKGQ